MIDSASMVGGQRWVSDSEPELGLGVVLKFDESTVDIVFPAAESTRCYALESAPLRRVLFSKGDRVENQEGELFYVTSLKEEEGVITYVHESGELSECELNDHMSFCKPQDRLYGAQIDDHRKHKLRIEALYRNYHLKKSPVRGLVGGRTDLIDHQVSIVNEVSSRLKCRAILADEVGLGKTIEACMIMHRLHITGRANRVLIVLPEPLMNQWFVELLRRFNLLFAMFDEERCESIEAENKEAEEAQNNQVNPFLNSQLVIVSVDFMVSSEKRTQQIIDGEWDLLILDEAHHIQWSEDQVSDEYKAVESLAEAIDHVLLLTATPQQLGVEGHFARLKLIDPEKFQSLSEFVEETKHYTDTAHLIEVIETAEDDI